jgi:hypothetical protein
MKVSGEKNFFTEPGKDFFLQFETLPAEKLTRKASVS